VSNPHQNVISPPKSKLNSPTHNKKHKGVSTGGGAAGAGGGRVLCPGYGRDGRGDGRGAYLYNIYLFDYLYVYVFIYLYVCVYPFIYSFIYSYVYGAITHQ
jgi:hypothetical protein